MRYLYGDATPFPLNENFIDTICAAMDACVGLFRLDEELAGRRQQASDLRRETDDELHRLNVLARAIEAALRPMKPEGEPATTVQATAQRIAQSASAAVDQARAAVMGRRDAGIAAAGARDYGHRVMAALAPFLLGYQLPGTLWNLDWSATADSASLELLAVAPGKLVAGFATRLPEGSRWLMPVRLCDFEPGIALELPRKAGWLRSGTRPHSVHRYSITRVTIGSDSASFTLCKAPGKSPLGYEICMRGTGHSTPVIYPIDDHAQRGEPLSLEGANEAALLDLWKRIESEMRALQTCRSELSAAELDEVDVQAMDEPAVLAESLLGTMAPLIREIRMRSRVPGELVLKRDLGDGRREEIFVPRRMLEDKYATLSEEHQRYFASIGLGGETTTEFVQTGMPMRVPTEEFVHLAPSRPVTLASAPSSVDRNDEPDAADLLDDVLGEVLGKDLGRRTVASRPRALATVSGIMQPRLGAA